jgi:hypothetical protein
MLKNLSRICPYTQYFRAQDSGSVRRYRLHAVASRKRRARDCPAWRKRLHRSCPEAMLLPRPRPRMLPLAALDEPLRAAAGALGVTLLATSS